MIPLITHEFERNIMSTRQLALSHPLQISHRLIDSRLKAGVSDLGALTITEGDSQTHFEFDVPGFGSDDIRIDLENNQLVVSGEIDQTEDSGTSIYTERRSRTFRRVLRLDSKLDPATADAELRDGVLRLSFARRANAERRQIEVRNTSSLA